MPAVQNTAEFRRVRDLPRRRWNPENTQRAIDYWTAIFRTPAGTQTLFAPQAQTLSELHAYRGALCGAAVGDGKTLISFLAPHVVGSQRPMLLMPGGLVAAKKKALVDVTRDWRVHPSIRIESYEVISRQGDRVLEEYDPDLIVADEAHKLKNVHRGGAACARAVLRFLQTRAQQGRRVSFLPMSGTFFEHKLEDFWHLAGWALPDGQLFMPYSKDEMREWSAALSVPTGRRDEVRFAPGALLTLPHVSTGDPLTDARHAFRDRMLDTPGVIMSSGEQGTGASLSIHAHCIPRVPDHIEQHFHTLRSKLETPDGWTLNEPMQCWAVATQLAQGFCQVWDPRPPHEWQMRRLEYGQAVREILRTNRRNLDTWLQVANAIDQGLYGRAVQQARAAWLEIEPTFIPNSIPYWLDDFAINACARWGRPHSIVWVHWRAFGERLAKVTGWPYYQDGGLTADGRSIEDADGKTPVIASIEANKTGRDLQKTFDRSLITQCPGTGLALEQLLGRQHRTGCTFDSIHHDVLITCAEHGEALDRARSRTSANLDLMSTRRKIDIADLTIDPWELESGPRWDK